MAVHCSVLRKRDLMRKLRRRAFKSGSRGGFRFWSLPTTVWLPTGVIQAGEKAERFESTPHILGAYRASICQRCGYTEAQNGRRSVTRRSHTSLAEAVTSIQSEPLV